MILDSSAIRKRLLDAGIQPSAPRMAIAAYVWNTEAHPTAEEVKREVERVFPTVSLATVYNTLNLFVQKGLLRPVQDTQSGPVKSVRYDCNTKPHFHFIDEVTGQMIDLDPRVLKITPNLNVLGSDFEISEIEVILKGRKLKASE